MRGGYETTGNYDAFCGIIARWNFGLAEQRQTSPLPLTNQLTVRLVETSSAIVHGDGNHRFLFAVTGDLYSDNRVADIDSPNQLLDVVADCYRLIRPFCV